MARVSLARLFEALEQSWSADTTYGAWTPEVPSLHQCAVTALVVQDYYGGDVIRYPILLRVIS